MNLALFDFDRTITVKDTFVPFVPFAMRPRRLPIFLSPCSTAGPSSR